MPSADEALATISQAVEKAGYKLGSQIAFALDPACTELSDEARQQLVKVHPGISRAALEKPWVETGGFVPCQHLFYEKNRGAEYVAVRIEWRPTAMPERVYANKNLRTKWLKRHVPLPAPDDVAIRVSRPYLTRCVID